MRSFHHNHLGEAMPLFHVDSEAVSHASANAQQSIARIQSEVTALHAQLTNLQSSWSGSAATAFQAVVAEWRSTAARVDESLTSINHALSLAAQQYMDIELATARMFRG
jgi:WXG100 family type VII secretion target